MIIFGFALMLLGIICVLICWKQKSLKRKKTKVCISLYFLIWGFLLCLANLSANSQSLIGVGLIVGFGPLSMVAGILNMYHLFICRLKIQGVYKGYVTNFPIFAYQVNGENFHQINGEWFSHFTLNHRYIVDQSYPIFISENHPDIFVLKRRLHLADFILVLFGLLLLVIGAMLFEI